MSLLDAFKIEVAATVTEGGTMSDEAVVEGAEAADAADAAAPAEDEAPAVEADAFAGVELEDEEPEAVNADGFAAVAGELFGGPDANQAVHETASEGFTVEESDSEVEAVDEGDA